jgi:hypothetical protein
VTMPGQSVAYFAKRARRRIIADLPDDLDATDDSDIMGVCRGRVHASLAGSARREAGLPPHARRPTFGLPASPSSTRRSNGLGQRPFHLGFAKPGHARSAAEDDAYASEKDARDRERAVQLERERAAQRDPAHHQVVGLELTPGDDGTGVAKANDAYIVKDQAKVALVYTNLDPDAALRRGQWDELVAHERKVLAKSRARGLDRINIDVAQSRELVEAVAVHSQCPAHFRERIGAALAGEKPGRSGVAWIDADAARTHAWIRTLPAWEVADTDARKALRHSPGRVVDDHDFIEVELPGALDALGRANVVRCVGDLVRALPGRADSHNARCQVPFVVVEHAPDALNDVRNGHFHLVRGKRRFLIGTDGRFVRDDDGNIIAEDHRVPAICALDAIKTFRGQIAEIVNDELEAARARERLHPGTYGGMGIDAVPMTKLRNPQTVLNRAGVRTVPAYDNAQEGWRRMFSDIDAEQNQAQGEADAQYRAADDRLRDAGCDPAVADRLRGHIAQAQTLRHEAAQAARDAAYLKTYAEIARSSTADPIAFADAYADARTKAGGSAYDIKGWRKRGAEARAFLTTLNAELDEEHAAATERRHAARALRVLADIADATFAADFEIVLAAQASATATTVDTGAVIAPALVTADDTKTSASSEANATEGSVHRVIDQIERLPLLLAREGDRYFIAANDDDARVGAARTDLNVRGTGARLAGLHRSQHAELATVRAHLVKHGDRRSSSAYVAALQARWSDQPVHARLVTETTLERLGAAGPVLPRSSNVPVPTPKTIDQSPQRVTAVLRGTTPREIPVGADTSAATSIDSARPLHRSLAKLEAARRADQHRHIGAAFERDLGVILGDRVPTRLAARALNWNQRYPAAPGAQTKLGYYASFAEQHALFMICPRYRDRAAKLAAGDVLVATEIARAVAGPDTDWVVKVGNRIDYRPHVKTEGSERLANLVDADLAALCRHPPQLTRAATGEVGIHDDEVLRRTHHNHLGLRLPKPQGVLVGLFLRQEVESDIVAKPSEANAAAAVASPQSNIAVRVWRRAVAQDENAYVLAFVGEQLIGDRTDRAAREARLAELSDDEKRKLKALLPQQSGQFVDAPPFPRTRSKRRARNARLPEGKSLAE